MRASNTKAHSIFSFSALVFGDRSSETLPTRPCGVATARPGLGASDTFQIIRSTPGFQRRLAWRDYPAVAEKCPFSWRFPYCRSRRQVSMGAGGSLGCRLVQSSRTRSWFDELCGLLRRPLRAVRGLPATASRRFGVRSRIVGIWKGERGLSFV